jgi:starch-binding outer membrane protein, SusD/RagB family
MYHRYLKYLKANSWTNFLLVPLLLFQTSCTKWTEVDSPPTSLTSDNVYQNDATANAVLIGLYASLSSVSPLRVQTFNSISIANALSADELTLHGGASNVNTNLVAFYLNKLTSGTPTTSLQSIWNDTYSKIYAVNVALEKLENSTGLTSIVKQQLTGEAKFLRGLFYFYLVNLYGDVPLVISSDYRENSQLSRSPKSKVYDQILSDLTDAQNLLSENFVGANAKGTSNERIRPSKHAATALLARSYLFIGNWSKAEEQASLVINNSAKFKLDSLNSVFLKNSNEAIWQMQPVNTGWNTEEGKAYILPATGPTSSVVEGFPVYLSSQLVNAFEGNDQRKSKWMGSVSAGSTTYNYAYKYKSATLNAPVTEYQMILRLGEQYLVRAEARAQQDNIAGAKSDLNMIRTRAGLAGTTATDKASILLAIQRERQVELFTEWGHRWLDLKRTNKVDEIMGAVTPLKGSTWNGNWQWYPIPLYEIIQNGNLEQNQGY